MIGTSERARSLRQHLGPVHSGQAEVEEDEIGQGRLESIFSGRDADYVEALTLEPGRERRRDRVVVLDDQDLHERIVACVAARGR